MLLTPVAQGTVANTHILVLHLLTLVPRHVYPFFDVPLCHCCELVPTCWLVHSDFIGLFAWHNKHLLFLQDLAQFLEQIGFSKYLPLLEEQDIDLRIFLTLTENDLKEIGIT